LDREAEVHQRRRRHGRAGVDLEQHEDEVGLLDALAQPHHARVAVVPVVDDVEAHVAAIEIDGALEVAHAECDVREDRFHRTCSATRVATISATMRRRSGISVPAAAACPPPPSASATFERSTWQSGERRRLTDKLVASQSANTAPGVSLP